MEKSSEDAGKKEQQKVSMDAEERGMSIDKTAEDQCRCKVPMGLFMGSLSESLWISLLKNKRSCGNHHPPFSANLKHELSLF